MLFGKFVIIRVSILILILNKKITLFINNGEMAEWTKAHDSKSCVVVRQPGVQIPLSPLIK
jgi:hypothetical protein